MQEQEQEQEKEELPQTLEELFNKLLLVALRCGVGVFEFWELTYEEIVLIIQNYSTIQKEQRQDKAVGDYTLAYLVGCAFGGKLPDIEEIHPHLFDKPKANNNSWILQKERMLDYANWHNKKIEKGGNTSDG